MRKIFFYSLLNLFVLFCISDINAQKIQRHIIGIVKDTISDKYLASVSVILEKDSYAITFKSTSTNNEGIFEFSNIDTGKYLLIFSYIGFAEKKISLAVNAEKDFKIR
ncbi:MAG: carboxypeptidase-like regulatory domain-containing protein [Chitinophagaceae bacterium]